MHAALSTWQYAAPKHRLGALNNVSITRAGQQLVSGRLRIWQMFLCDPVESIVSPITNPTRRSRRAAIGWLGKACRGEVEA
jgi:hypothetical protein